jgi:hypothetical protein
MCFCLLVMQVLLLLSSGVASVWQASSPDFMQQLQQQQQPTVAAKALAELAGSAVPIRGLSEALQQQLDGLVEGTAGSAMAAATQRCLVGYNWPLLLLLLLPPLLLVLLLQHMLQHNVAVYSTNSLLQLRQQLRKMSTFAVHGTAGASCACDHHSSEVPAP